MSVAYSKPHLSYAEQVAKLAARGLIVEDPARAADVLKVVGYYRLTGYLHVFRPVDPDGDARHDERLDHYEPGATFEHAVSLWQFDRALRMVLLDGLEQLEILMRTALAYHAGEVDPFIHYRPDLLASEFTKSEQAGRSKYDEGFEKYLERVDRAQNESFVKWFAHKYDGRLPIWTAIEIFEFGQTSRLIQGLPIGQRRRLIESLGLATQREFLNWIATLNGVRNVCAHHSRLWNRTLVTSASRPRAGAVPLLDHLTDLDEIARVKIYSPVAILVWLLRATPFGNEWAARLGAVLRSFPAVPQVTLANAGFPANWQELDLWNVRARKEEPRRSSASPR